MNTLDTRELIEKRDELKEQILNDWNEKFEDNQIDDFDDIPLNSEDEAEEDFINYWKEELVSDIGDLPRDIPSYLYNNIDWSGVADDIRQDYSEVEYQGTTYLYR